MGEAPKTALVQQEPEDKLILGEKKVLSDLNNIEAKGASLIAKIPIDAVKKFQDPDQVKQYILQQLKRSLWALWLAGWNVGGNHAGEEVKKQGGRGVRGQRGEFSKIAYFDGADKPGVQVRSIRNTPAENAIRGRINQLADDVTNSEYKRIQQHLLAAVTPQPETKQPISRSELLDRIEETLGTKDGRYARRAETIARTELTFAYNAGRLQTYRESGLVEAVKFYTISDERTCFPAGTMIATDTGERAIEQIKVGDMVLTRYGYRRVKATLARPYNGQLTHVKTSDGREVVSTSDHPFWTPQGWVEAQHLSVGQNLQSFHQEQIEISSVFNFSLRNSDYIPSFVSQESVFSAIPSLISMPVVSVNLQSYKARDDGEVNRVATYWHFLGKLDSQSFKRSPDSSLQSSFSVVPSVTRKTTKNAIIARDGSELNPTVFAGSNHRRPSAILRTIISFLVSLGCESLATPWAVLVNSSIQSAFFATDGVPVRNLYADSKIFFADRAIFGYSLWLFSLIKTISRTKLFGKIRKKINKLAAYLTATRDKLSSSNSRAFVRAILSYVSSCVIPTLSQESIVKLSFAHYTSFNSWFPNSLSSFQRVNTTSATKFLISIFLNKLQATKTTNNIHSSGIKENLIKINDITVYNLEVEEHPEYFANGVLVHNCPICSSRHGLVIPLNDWQMIAQNTPGLHVNCRCVLSPVLKKSPELKQGDRSISNRELVPRPVLWAAAGILAAVLVGGKATGAVKAVGQATKTVGGITLAQAIQQIREEVGEKQSVEQGVGEEVTQQQITEIPQETPTVKIGQLDLNTATREELQKILPGRSLTVRQVNAIIKRREQSAIVKIDDLKNVPEIGTKTFERLKQLSEGYQIIPLLDPRSIRTPTQLWAANLGLTKSQAQTIFDELQKGSFKDIEDLKARLKGKGIGDKTIENMQQRAVIIQRQLPPVKESVQQGVGGGVSGVGEELPLVTSTPRTPAPYSTSNLPPERVTPPRSISPTQPLKQEFDGIQNALNDFNETSTNTANKQLNSKELFGKSLKQQVSDVQNTIDGFRNYSQQVEAIETQITEWERRLGNLETNYQNLLDPTQPNYFEQAPQIIAQVRAQLQKAVKTIDNAVEKNNQYAAKIEQKIDAIEQRLNKLAGDRFSYQSLQSASNLRSTLDDFNTKIQNLETQITQLPAGSERSNAWLELQRLKRASTEAASQIRTVTQQLTDYTDPVVDTARRSLTTIDNASQAIASTADKLKQLQQRLEKLPTTKAQLPDDLKTDYDAIKDLRTVQRQIQTSTTQYRRTEELAQKNLETRAANQENFYTRYDDQYQRFEANVTPVLERRLSQIQADINELNAMPQGSIAWLLGFNGWETGNIPRELSLQLPGAPTTSESLAKIRQMAADVWRKVERINNNIETVKRTVDFKFINASRQAQDFPTLLKTAEDNLVYWQQQRKNSLNPANIGSSANRLDTLWREIQKAIDAEDAAKLQELYAQVTPDDAYGYARKLLLNMEEWAKRYKDLQSKTATPGTITRQPISELYNRYQQAQDFFLQQLGSARIQQSQTIEQALQDAQDIYQRIAYDANRVPTFDINGKAIASTDLIKQLEQTQSQVKKLTSTNQYTNPGSNKSIANLQEQIDKLDTTTKATAKDVEALTQEIDQLKQQRKGTTKKEKLLIQKRQELEQATQQIKDLGEELKDQKLGKETYQQIQQLKTELSKAREAIALTKNNLATVNQQLSNLIEQQQILGGGLSQRARKLSNQIEALQSQRARLVREISSNYKQTQELQSQLGLLRNQS